MGYITVEGRPIYLTIMPGRNSWDYCKDGEAPTIVSYGWYEEYAKPGGFGFVEV